MRLILIIVSLLGGCAHPNFSGVTHPSPEWVSEDCVTIAGYYYFVGYGEGQNTASALTHTLVSSRQSAITCLFSGSMLSSISIEENNSQVNFTGSTNLELNFKYIDWTGYTKVPGRVAYANSEKTKVYAQYQWNTSLIEKEKGRLAALEEKITRTEALKKEVELKRQIIEEQKEQLAQLNRQEEELRRLGSDVNRAIAKLKKLNEAHKKKEKDINKIIDQLYCGITINQFIELFREPDKVEFAVVYGSTVIHIDFFWDQFVIQVDSEFVEQALGKGHMENEEENRDTIVRIAKEKVIEFIYVNYALTNRGHRIC